MTTDDKPPRHHPAAIAKGTFPSHIDRHGVGHWPDGSTVDPREPAPEPRTAPEVCPTCRGMVGPEGEAFDLVVRQRWAAALGWGDETPALAQLERSTRTIREQRSRLSRAAATLAQRINLLPARLESLARCAQSQAVANGLGEIVAELRGLQQQAAEAQAAAGWTIEPHPTDGTCEVRAPNGSVWVLGQHRPAPPEPGTMASILETLDHEERMRAAGRLPARVVEAERPPAGDPAEPPVPCCVGDCASMIDPYHPEAQLCGQCSEYVCPEHQVTVDGDTWCTECDAEARAEQAREGGRELVTCEPIKLPGGGVAIVCSRGGRPARALCQVPGCTTVHSKLCDAPAPRRKSGTCDRRLCDEHATSVGEDRDLCPEHAAELERQDEPAEPAPEPPPEPEQGILPGFA